MPRVSPIQESFASGEIGQRVRGRVSIDAYKQGLAFCKNWYPLVQGPIRMRNGSQFIEAVDDDNWISGLPGSIGIRVFTFQRGLDEDAIVEVGDTSIVVRDSITGEILTGGVTGNLVPDPSFSTIPIGPSPNIFQSSVWGTDFDKHIFGTDPGISLDDSCIIPTGVLLSSACPDGVCSLAAQSHPNTDSAPSGYHSGAIENATAFPVNIPTGSELLVNEFSFTYYQFDQSLPLGHLDNLNPTPWIDPRIRFQVGTTKGASDVFSATSQIAVVSDYRTITHSFTPGAGNNILFFSLGMEWTGATPVVPSIPSNLGCDAQDQMSINFSLLKWIAPLAGGSGSAVEFVSPYTAEQLECLQVCMDPGEQEMWFTHPEVEPHRLRLAVGEFTFEALSAILLPTPFVAPTPNNWAGDNQPAACAFHEGRLWLGGSPIDPATLWASRSGDYVDFGNAAAAQKDDPLLFPLSSSGNIETLTSRKDLVINTDISEVIGTSQQGVIAFDDFSFPKQTDWGSNCIQPIVVGRNMVFTSNSRTRLRTFADEGGTNFGWDGIELSLLAQDIFAQPVRRMEYLDEPAYQACFLLADGTMGMATFFYPENVIGWWRYGTSYNGNRASGDDTLPGLPNQNPNVNQTINQIMDITKINTSAGAKLWMIVNRTGFPGTQKPGHELLAFEDSALPPTAVDSWAIRPIDPVTKTISDIDELTDQSVNAVIERTDPNTQERSYTVHPNVTVIAGVSSPFLDFAAQSGNNAIVGLFYENSWQLLPVEGVSNRGTAQVSRRRWNKIYLRLNDSPIPLVDGKAPKDRTPISPMGEGEPFITDDAEYSEFGSDQGELIITQDRPLISEVLALFGKVESTEV